METGSSVASSSAPVIMQTAQNIYAQTEALRNAGINRVEKYLAARGVSSRGLIAGTSTTNTAGFDAPPDKNESPVSKFAQTAAAGGLLVLKNAALFYPLFALLLLGTLYAFARKIKRRSKDD